MFTVWPSAAIAVVIVLACGCVVFIPGFIVTLVLLLRKNKNKGAHKDETEKIIVKDGVRYTDDKNITDAGGGMKVSHLEGDITLERGKEYTAKRGGYLMPGKYTALAAGADVSFYLRIGGLVREYKHNSGLVLSEGDKITATSHTVVLR